MSIFISPNCLLCNREVAEDRIALYIIKGTVGKHFPPWQGGAEQAPFVRFGGKVKPRGIICVECANNKLPPELHFEV